MYTVQYCTLDKKVEVFEKVEVIEQVESHGKTVSGPRYNFTVDETLQCCYCVYLSGNTCSTYYSICL